MQERLSRLFREFWESWKLVGCAALATSPILFIGLGAILGWTLVRADFQKILDGWALEPTQRQFLSTTIEQLFGWACSVILLGGFAALIYERLKRQDSERSKMRGFTRQLKQVERRREFQRLDGLLAAYFNFTQDNPGAVDEGFEEKISNVCYLRVIEYRANKDWSEAYKLMDELENKFGFSHSQMKMLYDFPRDLASSDENQYRRAMECLKQMEEKLRPSFLIHHQVILKKKIRSYPSAKTAIGEWVKNIPSDVEWSNDRDVVLYSILKWRRLKEDTFADWLRYQRLDAEKVEDAFFGVAEEEPEELLGGDYALDIGVQDGMTPESTILYGELGVGKTFMLRQIESKSSASTSTILPVRWNSASDLMTTGTFTVSSIIWSLLKDLREPLEARGLERQLRTLDGELLKANIDGDWKRVLSELKNQLKASGIERVFVMLDRVDDLPEVRRDNIRLAAILTAFFRQEVYGDTQPWNLKLFLSKVSFDQLVNVFAWNTLFKTVPITWETEKLSELIDKRIKYCALTDGPQRLDEFTDPNENVSKSFRQELLERSPTPQAALQQLDVAMRRRAQKWNVAQVPEESGLNIQDLDD